MSQARHRPTSRFRRYRLKRWLREHQDVIPTVASLVLVLGAAAGLVIYRYGLPLR